MRWTGEGLTCEIDPNVSLENGLNANASGEQGVGPLMR